MTISGWWQSQNCIAMLGLSATSGSAAAYALDSDYVNGTAGDAVGVRFTAPPGGVHLHAAYFFLAAADAGGQNLTCELCSYGATNTRAGTVIRSVTAAGGTTANKWIKFDFSAYTDALTASNAYWIVCADAAGLGNGYQVRARSSAGLLSATSLQFQLYTTADGWTTSGSSNSTPYSVVLVFSDGTVIGSPYTAGAADTSNALERGLLITGLTEDLSIIGIQFAAITTANTVQIREAATAPGGTVWSGFNGGAAYTIPTNAKTLGFCYFPSAVTLLAGVSYRLTFTYSSASTAPGYSVVEDAVTLGADGLAACYLQNNMVRTINNGAGGWTDYNDAVTGLQIPKMSLIIGNQVAIDTPAVGNVTEDDTVRGATGTYHEATAAEVQSGVQFGAGGAEYTGTYSPAGSGGGSIMGGTVVR